MEVCISVLHWFDEERVARMGLFRDVLQKNKVQFGQEEMSYCSKKPSTSHGSNCLSLCGTRYKSSSEVCVSICVPFIDMKLT